MRHVKDKTNVDVTKMEMTINPDTTEVLGEERPIGPEYLGMGSSQWMHLQVLRIVRTLLG